MKDEKRIINRLQSLAIEKCLNMENCQDIADVYEKHFCKKSLANGSQKGGAHGELAIASAAPEIEKIKAEMEDYLNGMNSCAEIDYSIYSQLFDFSLPLLQKAYELGKEEVQQPLQPDSGE